MSKLISDRDQSEANNHAQIIILSLFIDDCQSEPHYCHQNFSERRYKKEKPLNNTIIYLTGAPDYTWLLALLYVRFLLNQTHAAGINGVPITKVT